MAEPVILGHWSILIDGMEQSTKDFYDAVARRVEARELQKVKISEAKYKEGNLFSAKREYLHIEWQEFKFDICGAPYGKGFFVSWWLTQEKGCLASIPYIGPFFWPDTMYRLDVGQLFRTVVAREVETVLDELTSTQGLRALTADERKPILKSFFKR